MEYRWILEKDTGRGMEIGDWRLEIGEGKMENGKGRMVGRGQ
jgi:hypothetical protein